MSFSCFQKYLATVPAYLFVIMTNQNYYTLPVDNFGTVAGENPTPYGFLALWAVNGLSIVYWAMLQACMVRLMVVKWLI